MNINMISPPALDRAQSRKKMTVDIEPVTHKNCVIFFMFFFLVTFYKNPF